MIANFDILVYWRFFISSLMITGYVESWTRKRLRLCELCEYVFLIFYLVSQVACFLELVNLF